jgi:protein phosphatase
VDVGAVSHPGNVRPNNEDHYFTASFGRSLRTLLTNLPAGQVPERHDEVGYAFVVADGLGGEAAGEVASSLALTVAYNLFVNTSHWILPANADEVREVIERWRQRFRQIDQVLTRRAESDPTLAGMGTTMTAACSVGADLLLMHVGDSRAYLYHAGTLERLTRDQTHAQELADAGEIAHDEVAGHRARHVLTQALGRGGGAVEPEGRHTHLADGDRFLLCTDGLTEMVPDDRIADVLAHTPSSEAAARALVDLALQAGGRDNVTVVLAGYSIPAG